MSLGLNDVKKKAKNQTAPNTTGTSAKPWSADGLNSSNKSRRQEAAMTDEWTMLPAAPLFWLDPAHDSRLEMLQEKLVKIEERVNRALEGSLKFAQVLFQK